MTTRETPAEGHAVGPKPPRSVDAELLDVRAVALLLGGCSIRHIYRLADSGQMPRPIRLGRLIRWRRSELTTWLEGGCRPVRSATVNSQ